MNTFDPRCGIRRTVTIVYAAVAASLARRRSAAVLLATTVAVTACARGDDGGALTNQSLTTMRTLSVAVEKVEGSAVEVAPKSATLPYGTGLFLKAQIRDGAGALVPGARATWRTTNAAVAIVQALADSGLVSDHGRAVVSSIAPGTAMIIAQYESVADTARVTIVPRVDTVTPTPRPAAPRDFTLAVTVRGVLPIRPGLDSANSVQTLAGAGVTLTLLPALPNDTLPPNGVAVTTPTVVGTVVADANGVARFERQPAARFRISVQPPAGSDWVAQTLEFGFPWSTTIQQTVWLRKP